MTWCSSSASTFFLWIPSGFLPYTTEVVKFQLLNVLEITKEAFQTIL